MVVEAWWIFAFNLRSFHLNLEPNSSRSTSDRVRIKVLLDFILDEILLWSTGKPLTIKVELSSSTRKKTSVYQKHCPSLSRIWFQLLFTINHSSLSCFVSFRTNFFFFYKTIKLSLRQEIRTSLNEFHTLKLLKGIFNLNQFLYIFRRWDIFSTFLFKNM